MNFIAIGNHAVAHGVKAARAEVIAAYPITLQTQIIEKLSEFIERGEMCEVPSGGSRSAAQWQPA